MRVPETGSMLLCREKLSIFDCVALPAVGDTIQQEFLSLLYADASRT
jgi:hypothetical protein